MRKLEFVAHHSINHMAMVKIIETRHVVIGEDELPVDFERAHSRILYNLGVCL